MKVLHAHVLNSNTSLISFFFFSFVSLFSLYICLAFLICFVLIISFFFIFSSITDYNTYVSLVHFDTSVKKNETNEWNWIIQSILRYIEKYNLYSQEKLFIIHTLVPGEEVIDYYWNRLYVSNQTTGANISLSIYSFKIDSNYM